MLKNLKTYRKGYGYQTAERGLIGRLRVEYERDSYQNRPRGIYVTMRESTIEHSGVAGLITESFVIGGGRRGVSVLALELQRNTPKKTAMVAELVDAVAPEAAALYMADQWEAAVAKIREALAVLHA